MKILKVFAVACASVALLLVIAAAAVWLLFDPNDYRETIAAEGKRLTGRELNIDGRIGLRLLPHPGISVSDISLANVPGASRAAMMTIAEVDADVALWPLLRGELDIARLRISGLDVLLETNADGTGNWELALPPPSGAASDGSVLVVSDLIVGSARVGFRSHGSDHPLWIDVGRARLTGGSLHGHNRISAAGSIAAIPWSLQGAVGPLDGTEKAGRLPLTLVMDVAGAEVAVEGYLDSPLGSPQLALQLSAHGEELSELLAGLGVPVDDMGPFKLGAQVAGTAAELNLVELHGQAAGVSLNGKARIDLEGTKGPAVEFQDTELTWQGVHDGAAHAARLERLALRLAAETSGLELDYAGQVSGIPILGSGHVTRRGGVDDSSFSLRFDTTFGEARVHLDAAVQPHPSGPTGGADLQISGPDLSVPALALGFVLPLSGAYDLKATADRRAGASLGVTLGLKMAALEANLRGEVPAHEFRPENWASHLLDAQFLASGSGPDIAVLLEAFETDVPLRGPFQIRTTLSESLLNGSLQIQGAQSAVEIDGSAVLKRASTAAFPIVVGEPRGTANISGEDGSLLAGWLGTEGLRLGPYVGNLSLQEHAVNGSFQIALWEGQLRFSGNAELKPGVPVTSLASIETIEGDVSIAGDDTARLIEPLGLAVDVAGPFEATGRVSGNLEQLSLSGLQLTVDGIRTTGSARIELFAPVRDTIQFPLIRSVTIDGAQMEWSAGPQGQFGKFAVRRALVNRKAVGSEFTLNAAGDIAGKPFKVDGHAGASALFLDATSPYPVDLKGQVDGDKFSIAGTFGKPFGRGLNRLTFNVDVDDLKSYAALAGRELPTVRPFEADGEVRFRANHIELRDLSARIGRSDVNGSMMFNLISDPPRLSGRLTSKLIQLEDFLLPDDADTPAVSETGIDEEVRLLGEVPFPVDILRGFNADFSTEIRELRYGSAKLTDTSLAIRGGGGRLALELLGTSAGTTGIDGRADLDVTEEVPAAAVRFQGKKINVGQLLNAFDITDLITASANIDIHARGRGASIRDVLADLQGNASIVADGGRIDSKYFELVVSDLARELLPWRSGQRHTEINCFVARFDIKEGVATTNGLLLDTTRATIAGHGSVTLPTEELNFTVRPKPKEVSLVSLAFPIDVRGTIASPKFRPNKASLAVEAAKVAVGTAINPLGILIPFVRAGLGDKNPCVAALEDPASVGAGQGAEPKGIGGRLLKGLDNAVGGAVEGVGGAVDKVLGR